jgi:hypothetical protein
MFNVHFDPVTGTILGYWESSHVVNTDKIASFDKVFDTHNKRIHPDTREVMTVRPTAITEQRGQYLAAAAGKAPAGCFVEVGVWKGGSAWFLWRVAKAQNRALHLFDTFTGIPMQHEMDETVLGDFADTSLEDVKADIPDALFHVGVFPATMPDTSDVRDIAFVHFDGDQYESTKAVKTHIWPRMVRGGAIYFDDSEPSPNGGLTGVKRALMEDFPGQVRSDALTKMSFIVKE